MRIDAYSQINQIYKTGSKAKTGKVARTSEKDKVEISSFGKAYQIAKNAVAKSPDVREDRIAEIKSKIDSGTYYVSNEDLAEKLLGGYGETA